MPPGVLFVVLIIDIACDDDECTRLSAVLVLEYKEERANGAHTKLDFQTWLKECGQLWMPKWIKVESY